MDKWIVLLVVGISTVYLVRRIWRTMTAPPKDACGCGCSGCGMASSCEKGAEADRWPENRDGAGRGS
ncbi:FeoB-associated Cys-rich membrane protein [Desulfococcus sp.]|uniref:FeoB-associated Cys-rich membrane protein n=1 Tax=Desulfococcus sp. TaxID=2025834 RepID=UPI003D113080